MKICCFNQPRLRAIKRVCVLIVMFVTIVFIAGCASEQTKYDQYIDTPNRLYKAYLEGDASQARQSMLEIIQFVEHTPIPKHILPHAAAADKNLSFARLYVLETKVGNQDMAEAYLLQARYWLLKKSEMEGVSTEQAMKYVRAFTADKCKEFVETWDSKVTKGRGPRYALKP